MTEYRIDFKESELTSIKIPRNILSILKEQGEIREVTKDQRYYWTPNGNPEQLVDLLSEHKGVRITKLQGSLLR